MCCKICFEISSSSRRHHSFSYDPHCSLFASLVKTQHSPSVTLQGKAAQLLPKETLEPLLCPQRAAPADTDPSPRTGSFQRAAAQAGQQQDWPRAPTMASTGDPAASAEKVTFQGGRGDGVMLVLIELLSRWLCI